MLRLKRCAVDGLPMSPPNPRPPTAASAAPCPVGAAGVAGSAALLAEADRLGDPQVHIELSWTAPVVAGEQPLTRRGIGIQQPVGRLDQARLAGIGRDARPSVEQRGAV